MKDMISPRMSVGFHSSLNLLERTVSTAYLLYKPSEPLQLANRGVKDEDRCDRHDHSISNVYALEAFEALGLGMKLESSLD